MRHCPILINQKRTNMRKIGAQLVASLIVLGTLFLSAANAQWVKTSSPTITTYIGMLAADGGAIVAGSVGAFYVSKDSGAHWTKVISGLEGQFSIPALALKGNDIFGASGIGSLRISTDLGSSWHNAGGFTLGGAKIVSAFGIIGASVLAGTTDSGIYISSDTGMHWLASSSGLLTNAAVSCFSVNGSNIFAGTKGNGVFISADNGGSWKAINSGLANKDVRALATVGGAIFAGTAGKGVFVFSGSNSASWTPANTGLTDTTVLSFTVSGSAIFAGTYSSGVFMSTNNGGTWAAVNSGLTDTHITSLAVNGGILFATDPSGATGGMWQRPVAEMTGVTRLGPGTRALQPTGFTVSFPRNSSVLSIGFCLIQKTSAAAEVYSLSGRKITLLFNSTFGPGVHNVQWNSRGLLPGDYIIKLQAGSSTEIRKIPIRH